MILCPNDPWTEIKRRKMEYNEWKGKFSITQQFFSLKPFERTPQKRDITILLLLSLSILSSLSLLLGSSFNCSHPWTTDVVGASHSRTLFLLNPFLQWILIEWNTILVWERNDCKSHVWALVSRAWTTWCLTTWPIFSSLIYSHYTFIFTPSFFLIHLLLSG